MKRPAGAANDNDDESPSDSTKENKQKTTSIKKRPAAVAAEPVGSKVARKHAPNQLLQREQTSALRTKTLLYAKLTS